jgi:hypothetical protein
MDQEAFDRALNRADVALNEGSIWKTLTALRDALEALRPLVATAAEEKPT